MPGTRKKQKSENSRETCFARAVSHHSKKGIIHRSNEFEIDYLCSSGLILISVSVTLGHKIRGVTSVV